MKALNLYGVEDIRCEETTMPTIVNPDDVLIEVKATGICGSDSSRYKKLGPYIQGMTFGHEFSGIVAAVGSDVSSVKEGDAVVGCPAIVCYDCEYCERGEYARCNNLYVTGSYRPGSFAQYICMPESNVLSMDHAIGFEQGAMVEPSAVVAHGFYQSQIKPGDTVAIIGCGNIGLLAVQWAKIFGAAQIIAIDIDENKLTLAKQFGADIIINSHTQSLVEQKEQLFSSGVDLAVESAGAPQTLNDALMLPKKGGEVILIGIPYADMVIERQYFEKILRNELNVIGSWNGISSPFPGKEWKATLHYMSIGDLNVKPMITTKVTLEEGPEIFDKLVNRKEQYNKIMFFP